MSKRNETPEDDLLWTDLPVTGDLVQDISTLLDADMACGPNGCSLDAAEPLLRRALKEIRTLRRQLLRRT
jgi:hypothetical protein